MIKFPDRIKLANLPTKIEKLERFSASLGAEIYVKRDDQTGSEVSGNKIRKLEYSIHEAISQGCDYLITCGGIQSNHCRATAAAAAKLGLKSCLVLRKSEEVEIDGNLFINKLFSSDIRYITREEYKNNLMSIMEEQKLLAKKKGFKAYIIPEGASNGIGSFGYYNAMQEIIHQEAEMKLHFDAIILADGSGGTHAGLLLAQKIFNHPTKILGFNVCNDAQYFKNKIQKIFLESCTYLETNDLTISQDEIHIIDGYVGLGYALSQSVELDHIKYLATTEGLILDPVYTGKAMYGLSEEIKKGNLKDLKNILFLHTGGLFGLFPQKKHFNFS